MKLQIAPNLSLEGEFKVIACDQIIGLPRMKGINPSEEEILCFYPPAIVQILGKYGYTLINHALWEKDINTWPARILCFVLADGVKEEDIQRARTIIDVIHCNRANHKLRDVFHHLETNPNTLEIIKNSYEINSLREVKSLFSPHLLSDRSIRRIINKRNSSNKQHSSSTTEPLAKPENDDQPSHTDTVPDSNFATGHHQVANHSLETDYGPETAEIENCHQSTGIFSSSPSEKGTPEDLEKETNQKDHGMSEREAKARQLWEGLKTNHPEVLGFDEIIDLFPDIPDKAKNTLISRIFENPEDLKVVWERIRQRLMQAGRLS